MENAFFLPLECNCENGVGSMRLYYCFRETNFFYVLLVGQGVELKPRTPFLRVSLRSQRVEVKPPPEKTQKFTH